MVTLPSREAGISAIRFFRTFQLLFACRIIYNMICGTWRGARPPARPRSFGYHDGLTPPHHASPRLTRLTPPHPASPEGRQQEGNEGWEFQIPIFTILFAVKAYYGTVRQL